MNSTKVSYFFEKLWLVIAILTAVLAIYKKVSGLELSTIEYAFPLITYGLHLLRKTTRKRLEKAKRISENHDE